LDVLVQMNAISADDWRRAIASSRKRRKEHDAINRAIIQNAMPTSPPRPCSHPGCTQLVYGDAKCEQHKAAAHAHYDRNVRANDPRLAEAKRIRNTSQWQQLRDMMRACNPVCIDPLNVHGSQPAPTEHIHHITPLIDRPDLAFTCSNLAPLCIACHSLIEARERAGTMDRTAFDYHSVQTPIGEFKLRSIHAV